MQLSRQEDYLKRTQEPTSIVGIQGREKTRSSSQRQLVFLVCVRGQTQPDEGKEGKLFVSLAASHTALLETRRDPLPTNAHKIAGKAR